MGRSDAARSRQNFKLASSQVKANLQLAIAYETDLLFDEAAFMSQNPSMSPPAFWHWAKTLGLDQRYPALVGSAELRLIPRSALRHWIRLLNLDPPSQVERGKTVVVEPGGIRPHYCLTVASVSTAGQKPTAIDTDLDACSISPTLILTRGSGQTDSYGLAVPGGGRVYAEALPVYRSGVVPTTKAARIRGFIGWAGVAINPLELTRRALLGDPHMRLVLSRDDGTGLRFASGPVAARPETAIIPLADGMTAAISGPLTSASILSNSNASGVLAGGVLASLLIAALLLQLGTGRERARRTIVEKTGELEFRALHDALTDLPNRLLVFDRASHALARAGRGEMTLDALFIDVDGFKQVNDTFGHAAGDQLLQVVAERLRSLVRPSDTVGRIGGDEFVVLLEPRADGLGAQLVATRILDLMREPVVLYGGQEVTISVSIGIASRHRASADEFLRDADLALYAAKDAGKNQYVVFEEAMQEEMADHHALAVDLKRALAKDELFLVFQPTFELDRGTLAGVEALLRWQHPIRGIVSPAEFIPIAEETGEILPIGLWVLRQGCSQAAEWQKSGHAIHTSINVSTRQLDTPRFVDDVKDTLLETGLDPQWLTLEVTETALMRDPEAVAARLRELKALGIRIAIDDFGTGYSSLAYLHQLPVDTLKIDRTFVAGIAVSPDAESLMRSLVQLGKTLSLEVLGEGIEDARQLELLREAGCDLGQGFFLARPTDAGMVTEMLKLTNPESGPLLVPSPRDASQLFG